MLKFLKILTISIAIILIALKTLSVVVTGDSIFTLLPMYLIACWLLGFLIFKGNGPYWLLSGWGVLLGFVYFALIEESPNLPPRPMFADIFFLVLTIFGIGGTLLASNSIHASRDHDSQPGKKNSRKVLIVSALIAGMLILAGIFSLGSLMTKISYFILGAILVISGLKFDTKPKISPIGLSVVSGFVSSDLVGLIRFLDTPRYILIITVMVTILSLIGLVLSLSYTNLKYRFPKTNDS